jgi:hypothetical protein
MKSMIGHSLSTYKIRGKTKIDIHASIEHYNSRRQNSIYIKLDLKEDKTKTKTVASV